MAMVPLQCERMASAAKEYCHLIDEFGDVSSHQDWIHRMAHLLPRLHVAVMELTRREDICLSYHFPDDDARCELYMHLHNVMGENTVFHTSRESPYIHFLCDRLADDFTDMYYDLKAGLGIIEYDPWLAMDNWLCSFYLHWGGHLLDAEYCLGAVHQDGLARPV